MEAGTLREGLKIILRGIFLLLATPMAAVSGFGRSEAVFLLFAHACALVPGRIGDYLRIAYYKLTLEECALDSRIEFGSFFAHPHAAVGASVYIGPYCVLGRTRIGDRTQIASGVQILSGRRQHARDSQGRIGSADSSSFSTVPIGSDCWIGAAAIVMAEIGPGATIGAGSIVVKPIPANSVAVGNPARVIQDKGSASGAT
jgi:virginiamycin A acetyltransferase